MTDYTAAAANLDTESLPYPEADPALLRRLLGMRLRRLREGAGIKGDTAARAIRASHSKISRLEAGLVGFRIRDVEDLLSLYGVVDATTRASFLVLARRANASGRRQLGAAVLPRWVDTYLALEDAATLVRGYAPGVIPELLQTRAYAEAVLGMSRPIGNIELRRRADLLTRRQHLLTRPDPPRVWLAVEEAALRRRLGGLQVWRDQLAHIADLVATHSHITVQIVPDHVGGPAISAVPFSLLRFSAADLNDVVYLHHATGAQFLDKRNDLDAYQLIWDRLCIAATPPDTVATALRSVARAAGR